MPNGTISSLLPPLLSGKNFFNLLLGALLLFFLVYSLVLLYHSLRFGPKNLTMLLTTIIYFAGAVLLILGLYGTLLSL